MRAHLHVESVLSAGFNNLVRVQGFQFRFPVHFFLLHPVSLLIRLLADYKNTNNVVINYQLPHLLFQNLNANYMQYFRDSRERFGKFGVLTGLIELQQCNNRVTHLSLELEC